MIVTSKRVFINVLVQYMSFQDLLKATYYVPDVQNSAANVHFDKEVVYHDDGTTEIINKPITSGSISRFNIIYGDGWLDPVWAVNMATTNAIGDLSNQRHETAEQIYVKRLQSPQTIIGVRDWLYGTLSNPRKHRGLRIIIINDEDIVRQFGHIMCAYLAHFFGEDITFLDPKYRPQIVPGKQQYVGDKAFAKKMLSDLGDYDMMMKLTGLISQTGYDMACNNLTCFLETVSIEHLFMIYEKLFPYEPLPAGNYTKQQIITIISGKCAEKLGVVYDVNTSRSNSLSTIQEYLDALDAEIGDF